MKFTDRRKFSFSARIRDCHNKPFLYEFAFNSSTYFSFLNYEKAIDKNLENTPVAASEKCPAPVVFR